MQLLKVSLTLELGTLISLAAAGNVVSVMNFVDIGIDVGLDMGTDEAISMGIDVGLGMGLGMGTDMAISIGVDVGIDVGIDVGVDVGVDVVVDVGSVANAVNSLDYRTDVPVMDSLNDGTRASVVDFLDLVKVAVVVHEALGHLESNGLLNVSFFGRIVNRG